MHVVGKTFDRYLLNRFLFMFAGFFAASMGLFAVVDGFTNLDAFQSATQGQSTFVMLSMMGKNYLIRSSWVFDLIGPTMITMSAVAVIALLIRHGEINPLLAAGVPTYRLAAPLLVGTMLVHGLLWANKELVLPRIASHLTGNHGEDAHNARHVETQADRRSGMIISGSELIPATRTLRGAEFRLGGSTLVREWVTLTAEEAVFHRKKGDAPAGWLLIDVQPQFDQLSLTEQGVNSIVPQPNGTDVFIVTGVSWDQLYSQGTSYKFLSTNDLLARVRRPTAGKSIMRAQVLHVHERFTRPLLNFVGILLAIPLLIRRESRSLVTNIAICMAVLATIVGLAETCSYLGKTALMTPEAATWVPVMVGGAVAAWFSPRVQT